MVVVDLACCEESRTFVRMADASSDVDVAYTAGSIDEAKRIVARGDASGICHCF